MFVVVAVLFVLIGLAWLIAYELFPAGQIFWGFFIVAGAAARARACSAGCSPFRALRGGAPPAPTMAIDEARKIREAVARQREDAA